MGRKAARVQRVQRGRWTEPLAPKVVAAWRQQVVFASLMGQRPSGPRVVVSPLRGDEHMPPLAAIKWRRRRSLCLHGVGFITTL